VSLLLYHKASYLKEREYKSILDGRSVKNSMCKGDAIATILENLIRYNQKLWDYKE
jgi:hypothetical protein